LARQRPTPRLTTTTHRRHHQPAGKVVSVPQMARGSDKPLRSWNPRSPQRFTHILRAPLRARTQREGDEAIR
jgi:hypothetical protein